MTQEQELWLKHCKIFKDKLKEITDPVAMDKHNRSYRALEDVITNIILLEINIDKEAWNQIPKREVPQSSTEERLYMIPIKDVANYLYKELNPHDEFELQHASKENKKEMLLKIALENYLSEK